MRFPHTVQIAIAINARVVSDDGAPIAAYIGRIVYLFWWLPGWLYGYLVGQRTGGFFRAVFDVSGWRADLPLIFLAAWLLVRDRGFCYG